MFNKLTLNAWMKVIVFSLAIPFAATVVNLLLSLQAVSTFSSGGLAANLAFDRLIYILWIFVSAGVIPLALKNIRSHFQIQKREKENLFQSVQNESEKQDKLVNNLTNLYHDLVEYDRLKTEFFSNISHELKTPLSIILGAIQLIDRTSALSEAEQNMKHSRHLQTMKQNCYRLVRLVNNLLDITRLDSGYIKLQMINCNFVYLVEEITQSVLPYAQQKNVTVEFDTDVEEINMAVDTDKIERIILNLLSNAIKFTPAEGKISVAMRSTQNRVFISVKDTGPGIPRDMQNTIFERFRQLDSTLSKQSEGSGIGLSIVKSFIVLHNGSIRVESEPGKGSEFIIELPILQCKSCSSKPEGLQEGDQSRIIEMLNVEFSDIYTTTS